MGRQDIKAKTRILLSGEEEEEGAFERRFDAAMEARRGGDGKAKSEQQKAGKMQRRWDGRKERKREERGRARVDCEQVREPARGGGMETREGAMARSLSRGGQGSHGTRARPGIQFRIARRRKRRPSNKMPFPSPARTPCQILKVRAGSCAARGRSQPSTGLECAPPPPPFPPPSLPPSFPSPSLFPRAYARTPCSAPM